MRLDPQSLPAKYNLGFTYKAFGDIDTAIALYKEILAVKPDYEQAQLALGFAYITQGDFENGWPQHTQYLKQSGKNADALRSFLQNDTIPYKRLFLRPEGGLGDTINFIRYAQTLKNIGCGYYC